MCLFSKSERKLAYWRMRQSNKINQNISDNKLRIWGKSPRYLAHQNSLFTHHIEWDAYWICGLNALEAIKFSEYIWTWIHSYKYMHFMKTRGIWSFLFWRFPKNFREVFNISWAPDEILRCLIHILWETTRKYTNPICSTSICTLAVYLKFYIDTKSKEYKLKWFSLSKTIEPYFHSNRIITVMRIQILTSLLTLVVHKCRMRHQSLQLHVIEVNFNSFFQ